MERLLTPPDPPLSSQGFRLRPFTVKDAEAVKAAGEDPDIVRYTFMPAAPTDETTVPWLTRAIEGWHHGMGRFAIVPATSRHVRTTDEDRPDPGHCRASEKRAITPGRAPLTRVPEDADGTASARPAVPGRALRRPLYVSSQRIADSHARFTYRGCPQYFPGPRPAEGIRLAVRLRVRRGNDPWFGPLAKDHLARRPPV